MTATRLAVGLWALVGVLAAVSGVCFGLAGTLDAGALSAGITALIVFLLLATLGVLIVSRHPANPVGWLFCAVPVLLMAANAVSGYVELAVARELPGGVGVSVALGWTWLAGLGLLIVLILLFPDGRLPSPRWRPVAWLAIFVISGSILASVFRPGPLDEPLEHVDNPVGLAGMNVFDSVLLIGGAIGLAAAAVLALTVRFRRRDEQRQQIKWVLAAAAFAASFIVATAVADGFWDDFPAIPDALFLAVLGTIPLATALAMLRYRLYEIDRIVNRTLVYGGVSAVLAGLYFGLVVALQQAFSSFAGGSDLAVAGSTLAVAALFRPVRRRIQAFVDRRFYRGRYDVQRTLEAFGTRVRDEVELAELTADLQRVVVQTMQPAHVSLWLRPKDRAR